MKKLWALLLSACIGLGTLVAQDINTLKQQAQKGNASAQFNLGNMYREGQGVPQDYGQAVKWYRLAADQGYASAQSNLGVMYDEGDAQTQSADIKKLIQQANQGDAQTQNILGWMYANGQGVPQDDVHAAKWYRLAADQGDADGQTNLGHMYDNGSGVPQDDVQAHKWFSLAAAQGDVNGAKNRDSVAERMTPQQLAQAEELARNWKPKKQ